MNVPGFYAEAAVDTPAGHDPLLTAQWRQRGVAAGGQHSGVIASTNRLVLVDKTLRRSSSAIPPDICGALLRCCQLGNPDCCRALDLCSSHAR